MSYVKIVLPANSLDTMLTRVKCSKGTRSLLSDGTANEFVGGIIDAASNKSNT